jgi:hypothetical protein
MPGTAIFRFSVGRARTSRERRPLEHSVEDRRPHARLPGGALLGRGQERDPALVHPVAQLREDRRQHGQRADDGDRDHQDGAGGEGDEGRRARQVEARHRDHHRDARDEHGTPRGRRGGLERRLRALAAGPLLPFAPQVEHRVVDPDGEADQENDRGNRLVDREHLADRAEQADRGGDRGGGEAQRDQRRDQRAERQQQDDQRDRQGGGLGLLEVVLERLRDRLVGAGRAELLDPVVGVRLVEAGHGRQRCLDIVIARLVRAGGRVRDLELDQGRVPIGRDRAIGPVGALDLEDVVGPLELGDHVVDRALEGGIGGDRAVAALNEHRLGDLVRECPLDRLIGGLGAAGSEVLVGDVLGADGPADHHRRDDEREPADDRGGAVGCTPFAGARGEVSTPVQCGIPSVSVMSQRIQAPGDPAKAGCTPGLVRLPVLADNGC